MNVLIIGGSGFVSGTLARLAVEEGHRVWAVTRGRRPMPPGVTGLQADRHDENALKSVIESVGQTFDVAIDCIGYKPEDARQDLAIAGEFASHLVFISTDFVFDPERRVFPTTESHAEFLTDDSYGANKRRCEEVLLEASRSKVPWTVLRPCHIYGPGSLLGCLPCHGRDAELLDRLRRGEALRLVGGGHFLQQPIFAEDLAQVALACPGNPRAAGRIFHTSGPDIVESSTYYQIIAREIGCSCLIDEVSVLRYRAEHPEHRSFLCHRIYTVDAMREAGLPVPATPLTVGLRRHVASVTT